MKEKSLPQIITQLVTRNLGMYASSYMGNDIYFLIEAINILVSYISEDELKKAYEEKGKEWGKVKEKMAKMNYLANQIKIFYDPILDKKFEKKTSDVSNVQNMFKTYFRKTAGQMAIMQRDLYDLFIFLVVNTSLYKTTIPTDAFKIIEHTGFRKMDMFDKTKARTGVIRT